MCHAPLYAELEVRVLLSTYSLNVIVLKDKLFFNPKFCMLLTLLVFVTTKAFKDDKQVTLLT